MLTPPRHQNGKVSVSQLSPGWRAAGASPWPTRQSRGPRCARRLDAATTPPKGSGTRATGRARWARSGPGRRAGTGLEAHLRRVEPPRGDIGQLVVHLPVPATFEGLPGDGAQPGPHALTQLLEPHRLRGRERAIGELRQHQRGDADRLPAVHSQRGQQAAFLHATQQDRLLAHQLDGPRIPIWPVHGRPSTKTASPAADMLAKVVRPDRRHRGARPSGGLAWVR